MPDPEDRSPEIQPALFSERAAPPPAEPPPVPAAPPGLSIADGEERSLDPGSITLDRISRSISTAVLAAGSFIGISVLMFTSGLGLPGRFLLLAAWGVLVAFLAAMAWFWPPVRYRHIHYRLDGNGMRIRRGVIWRAVISVPQSRVQHTDVSQGPLERTLGLATLIVHTAGTQNASVSLGGLRHEDAARIRDYLIDVDERDAV